MSQFNSRNYAFLLPLSDPSKLDQPIFANLYLPHGPAFYQPLSAI